MLNSAYKTIGGWAIRDLFWERLQGGNVLPMY